MSGIKHEEWLKRQSKAVSNVLKAMREQRDEEKRAFYKATRDKFIYNCF